MRRRGAGIGAIQKDKKAAERFKDKGNELAESNFQEMTKQMENFRQNLEEFAREHREDIKKNPKFRKHFQEMCTMIGVDPLASSKGFWSEMLGFGDFYYELAVQIIEICMASSHRTGGLMEAGELRQRLLKSRGLGRNNKQQNKTQDISIDDVLRAIKKLKVLGNGFTVIPLGTGRYLVQSIPGELSMDQTTILQKSESNGGFVCISMLESEWDCARSQRAINLLIGEGLAWIDNQNPDGETLYWIPSIYSSLLESC